MNQTQYTKLLRVGEEEQRVTVLIHWRPEHIAVGLYNHAYACDHWIASLGFRLPVSADPTVFVDDFCEIYAKNPENFVDVSRNMRKRYGAEIYPEFEAEVIAVAVEN